LASVRGKGKEKKVKKKCGTPVVRGESREESGLRSRAREEKNFLAKKTVFRANTQKRKEKVVVMCGAKGQQKGKWSIETCRRQNAGGATGRGETSKGGRKRL